MRKFIALLFVALILHPTVAPANDALKKLVTNTVSETDKKAGSAGMTAAQKKEQSEASTKQALGMAAMSLGGMQLGQGLAQNAAEKAGAARMQNYQNTWMCGVGSAKGDKDGEINWHGPTVKAGEVGQAPSVPELQRLIADFTIKQNQIKAAKGEVDMVLSDEEQKTFARHNLYGESHDLEEGELYKVSTGGGNTKIAVGAGLAGAGAVMSAGGDYKTAIGTGMLTGGGAGALVADTTTGRVAGVGTALGGAGVLAHGAGMFDGLGKGGGGGGSGALEGAQAVMGLSGK